MRFLLLIFLSVQAFPATYYVRTTGSDSNTGSEVSPYLTLDKGLQSATSAGDIVDVGTGTFTSTAATRASGTSGSPITIRGAGSGQTILTRVLTVSHANIVADGLTFDGYGVDGTLTSCYLLASGPNCTNLLVRNSSFSRGISGVNSANVGGFPSYVTVRSNEFHHPTGNGMVVAAGGNWTIEQNYFHDSVFDALRPFGPNHVIRSNYFTRVNSPDFSYLNATSASSLSIGTGTKIFTIQSGKKFSPGDQVSATSDSSPTTLRMTGFVTGYDGSSMLTVSVYQTAGIGSYSNWTITTGTSNVNGNHADIIQTFQDSNNSHTTNLLFSSNRIVDGTSQFGNLENDSTNVLIGDWIISNNIFRHSRIQLNAYVPDVKILNNTIYDTAGYTVGMQARYSTTKGAGHNMIVKNNLFIHIDGNSGAFGFNASVTGCLANYNIYTSQSNSALTLANGAGANSINGGYTPSQIFIDPEGGDLQLLATSPALNAGDDLSLYFTTDFLGESRVAWDIGAYEGSVPQPPSISTIVSKTMGKNGELLVPFTVGDDLDSAASLTVTRASSNTTLLPLANCVLGGSGASRTVTLSPAANELGSCTITLGAADSGGLTNYTAFTVSVNDVPYPPQTGGGRLARRGR
jgi:hypothetical protein